MLLLIVLNKIYIHLPSQHFVNTSFFLFYRFLNESLKTGTFSIPLTSNKKEWNVSYIIKIKKTRYFHS